MSHPTAAFHFDLASPESYLVAERILQTLPHSAEWQPVLASELGAGGGPGAGGGAGAGGGLGAGGGAVALPSQAERRRAVELRAAELGLQRLRWPEPFPFESALAMRVATYAKSIGRTVPFALAAFRQAFAGGRALDEDGVVIAAAACEMHPSAVLSGASLRSTEQQLAAATARARELGVRAVPAITVGEEVFQGEEAPERAALRMRELAAGAPAA